MNNDDWLSNLASSLGLDSGILQENPSAISTASPDLYQIPDPSISLEATISPTDEIALPLPDLNTDILSPHHHYDPNHFQGIVIGDPDEAMKHFHQQDRVDTCAIAVQQSIIEDTTGVHLYENQLVQTAQNYDLYYQGVGTPINRVGDLFSLETNIPVEKHFGGSLAEITQKIAEGEQVMVSVNAQIANVPDSQSIFGALSAPILDNSIQNNHVANHVEEVIGIGFQSNDPLHPVVIVNDPSSADGKGVEIPAEQFIAAWETGGNFMASTVNHPEANLSNLGADRVDDGYLPDYNVGCKVSFDSQFHHIHIDGSYVFDYNGHTYYNSDGSIAGTWACASNHHAYTAGGKDLGYAPTEEDAVMLVYKHRN